MTDNKDGKGLPRAGQPEGETDWESALDKVADGFRRIGVGRSVEVRERRFHIQAGVR